MPVGRPHPVWRIVPVEPQHPLPAAREELVHESKFAHRAESGDDHIVDAG